MTTSMVPHRRVRAAIRSSGGRDAIAAPYGEAYPIVAHHPLALFGFRFWDGP